MIASPAYTGPAAAEAGSDASMSSLRRRGDSDLALTAILAFPYLRSVLDPQYRSLPADELESLMTAQFGEGSAEAYDAYLEGIFGDVGKWISGAASDVGRAAAKAAPVVANIGGGVIRGATAGAALGLPGIIGGAVAGGVGQGFSSYGSGTLRDIGHGLNTATNLAGQFSGTGRLGATLGGAVSDVGRGRNIFGAATSAASGLLGGGTGAGALLGRGGGGLASALGSLTGRGGGGVAGLAGLLGGAGGGGGAGSGLLSLLGRPEMLQALGAMGLGSLGAKSIPVGAGRTPVPSGAFANLLGLFAQSVADEQASFAGGAESKVAYLLDDTGEWAVDPAEPRDRAVHLARLLDAAQDERDTDVDREIELRRAQQLERQQDVLQAHRALLDRLRAARDRQQELADETAMLDAIDLVEAAAFSEGMGDDVGEGDEAFDEGDEAIDEADEAFDEDTGEGDLESLLAEIEEFDEYFEPISA